MPKGNYFLLLPQIIFAIKASKVRKKPTARKPAIPPAVEVILAAIKEKKGENITTLDLRGVKDAVCDFFVICDAESTTQVKAIAGSIEELTAKKLKEKPWHVEGVQQQEWILLDYVDVVVHVFRRPMRAFYQLEELWSDGILEVHNA